MSRTSEFGAYVTRRRAHLYRTAWLLCGDPHRAEDLVQETLTKLFLAWPRVSRADKVEAYVRRMLVNANIDESRRPWRRERPTAELPDATAVAETSGDTEALWTALRSLPSGQRRVVVLRHYWGLSVDETAADLGVSSGTVKSQTSAALTSLRRSLTPDVATRSSSVAVENKGANR